MSAPIVLKIGGQELDSETFVHGLAEAVRAMATPPVIVHGGGRGATQLAARLQLQTRFVDGLRVTDDETLDVAVLGLVGGASTTLVQGLVNGGVPALGLSGVDAALVRVQPDPRRDLGWVGVPTCVDAARLRALVAAGFVPCLAPISLGEDGHLYNVNADTVAAAVAAALDAPALVMVTAAPGVLDEGRVVPRLTPTRIDDLIAQGIIRDGMIPKVRAACDALRGGVQRVRIVDLAGLSAWLEGATDPLGTEIASE